MFLRFLAAGLLRTKSVSFPDLVVFSEMLLKEEAEDPLNRTIASSLFSFGYGYRTVGKMLNLSSIWLSRDWARQHRKLSIVQARKIKRSKK